MGGVLADVITGAIHDPVTLILEHGASAPTRPEDLGIGGAWIGLAQLLHRGAGRRSRELS